MGLPVWCVSDKPCTWSQRKSLWRYFSALTFTGFWGPQSGHQACTASAVIRWTVVWPRFPTLTLASPPKSCISCGDYFSSSLSIHIISPTSEYAHIHFEESPSFCGLFCKWLLSTYVFPFSLPVSLNVRHFGVCTSLVCRWGCCRDHGNGRGRTCW